MRHWIFILMIACCVVAGLSVVGPKQATADEYWDGYWSWYDGTYSPYYSRRHYAPPSYS